MAAAHTHINRRKLVCARPTNALVLVSPDQSCEWICDRTHTGLAPVLVLVPHTIRKTKPEKFGGDEKIDWPLYLSGIWFWRGLQCAPIHVEMKSNANVWVKTTHLVVEQTASWRAPHVGFTCKQRLHGLNNFDPIQWDGAAYAVWFPESNRSARKTSDGQMAIAANHGEDNSVVMVKNILKNK